MSKEAKSWPPKGWTIKKISFTEDSPEPRTGRMKGDYWQGISLDGLGTTCYYKDYDDCLDAVKWYATGMKSNG